MARVKANASKKVAAIEVRRMRIVDILPAELNPRVMTEEAIAGLGASVREFGYVEPMVWNKRSKRLVSGHQRLRVLKEQGFAEADVSVVDLESTKEKLLLIEMNNRHIQGDWDTSIQNMLKNLEITDEYADSLKLNELMIDANKLFGSEQSAFTKNQLQELESFAYRIIVECRDESHQKELYERFQKENLACKLLMS